MKIEKTEILPKVFRLVFETQYELAATMLRFQEFYESPRFKGKVFTLEMYMDWYADKFGNFTYYQDWAGFNIPSKVLAPFYHGRFDPLSKKETALLRLFKKTKNPFYVIAIQQDDLDPDSATLKHELAHALFYLHPEYKREVISILKENDFTGLERELHSAGYHGSVIQDEVQAYLIAGIDDLVNHVPKRIRRLSNELKPLFNKYRKRLRSGVRKTK